MEDIRHVRKMKLSGEGVCNFTCFTVIALNKNSANIFNIVFKTPEVKSHLILHDELFKMSCEI